jgi:hypothetical protein
MRRSASVPSISNFSQGESVIKQVHLRQSMGQPPVSSSRYLAFAACLLSCVACGPGTGTEGVEIGPLQGRFYVSDEFSPSGHMGDGQNPGFITADINENCKERPPGAGGACYRYTYQPDLRPGANMWAGVYWVYPSNDWGTRPGRLLIPPYKKVRFKAAADLRPDPSNPETKPEPRVVFQIGGIGTNPADPQPYKDETIGDQTTGVAEYLTSDWKSLEIDLTGYVPTDHPFHMISGFCWTVNYQPGIPTPQSPPTRIYLDDIVWDTE